MFHSFVGFDGGIATINIGEISSIGKNSTLFSITFKNGLNITLNARNYEDEKMLDKIHNDLLSKLTWV